MVIFLPSICLSICPTFSLSIHLDLDSEQEIFRTFPSANFKSDFFFIPLMHQEDRGYKSLGRNMERNETDNE